MRPTLLFLGSLLLNLVSAQTESVQYGDSTIELNLPGRPLSSAHVNTDRIDGLDLAVPKRHLSLGHPPSAALDTVNIATGREGYYHPRAAAVAVLKRAPPPKVLFGSSGLPHWTDPRQNESIASCGLTSALQSLAYVLPELLASNLFIQEDAPLDPSGEALAVMVGVTNWNVAPYVKSAVVVQRSPLNSSNMMAGDIWWPGAFEKAVEALGQNTTFFLSSRAMTMVSGLEATYNITTNAAAGLGRSHEGKEGPVGVDKAGTWAVLAKSGTTPITLQTDSRVQGELQANHVFVVLRAQEVEGVRMLTLHNPHGWDHHLPYDQAWPQLYLFSYLVGMPTRADFGLGEMVDKAPYTLVLREADGEGRRKGGSKGVEAGGSAGVDGARRGSATWWRARIKAFFGV